MSEQHEQPGQSGVPAEPEQPGQSERAGPSAGPSQGQRPGRYERSPAGLVGALLVTLLVILAFVGFRAFNRSSLEVKPERVDYLSQVRIAQQEGQSHAADLVYPARLPSGWYATNVTFASAGTRPQLELSMLTADGGYVGLVQSPTALPELLTTYVDPHPQAGPPVTVRDSVTPRWKTWTDSGGDTALAAEHDHESLLVFGTVPRAQLEQLAGFLTTANLSD